MITPSLDKFLMTRKATDKDSITHTNIGDKKMNIYGGSYHIPDSDLPRLYELNAQDVLIGGKPAYLTEVQYKDDGIHPTISYVDVDFNYATLGRYHTTETIEIILMAYTSSMKKYLQFSDEDSFNVFVTEREKPYFNGEKNKDGLHIIFGINIPRTIQALIRKDVMANIDLSELPLINTLDQVFDEGIIKGTTNLQLFGSRKPGCEPYKVSHAWKYTYDSSDGEFADVEFPIDLNTIMPLISARGNTSLLDVFPTKLAMSEIAKVAPKTKIVKEYIRPEVIGTKDINDLKITQCFSPKRIDETKTWFELGWAIANVFGKSSEVCQAFADMNDKVPSRKSCKMDAKDWFDNKCEIRTGKDALGWGSLVKWAREDNMTLYDELFPNARTPEENRLFDLFQGDYSTGRLGEYFAEVYNKNFIAVDGMIYNFTGIYWKKDDSKNTILHKFLDTVFHKKLYEYLERQIAVSENPDVLIQKQKMINKIRDHSGRKQLIEDIIIHLNKSVQLDQNPFLFAFENKVFDLSKNAFVEPNPEDYLTMSCGWEYDDKYGKSRVETVNRILTQIFPNELVRNYYMEGLSTGLFGQQVEHLFIATGIGGNGKSLINSLAMSCFGNYGYKLPSTALLGPIKEGANPQMANLHKKRFVLTQEPDAKRRLNTSTMKELTGDKILNVRDNYSSMCNTMLHNTTFMEANELPLLDKISHESANAILRRLATIPFESLFTEQAKYDEMDDKTNVFVGDSSFKSDKFQVEHRQALFEILKEHFKVFNSNKLALSAMPPSCFKAGQKYYMMSDDFLGWFNDTYEVCDKEFVYVSDIFSLYKISSAFELLTKEEKRKITKTGFTEKIQKHPFLRRNFKDRDDRFNGKQLSKPGLVGFRRIPSDELPKEDDFME